MPKLFTSDYQPPNSNKAVRKRNFLTSTLKKFINSDRIEISTSWTEDINGVKKSFKRKIIAEGAEGEKIGELIASVLIEKAIKGDLDAIKMILDRTEGPVRAQIGVTEKGETVIILPSLDDDKKGDPPASRISD